MNGILKTPTCYKGIQSRCRLGEYNEFSKKYSWEVEIKNNYSKKVSITFDIRNSSMDGRTVIEPGGIDKSSLLNASNVGLDIEFSNLCFHHPNGYSQCSDYEQDGYATCDNGAPKYTVYKVSAKNAGSSIGTSQNNYTSNSPQSGHHHNCSNMIYTGQPQGYQKCGCCGQLIKTDYTLPANCKLPSQSCGPCGEKSTINSLNTNAHQNHQPQQLSKSQQQLDALKCGNTSVNVTCKFN